MCKELAEEKASFYHNYDNFIISNRLKIIIPNELMRIIEINYFSIKNNDFTLN